MPTSQHAHSIVVVMRRCLTSTCSDACVFKHKSLCVCVCHHLCLLYADSLQWSHLAVQPRSINRVMLRWMEQAPSPWGIPSAQAHVDWVSSSWLEVGCWLVLSWICSCLFALFSIPSSLYSLASTL